MPGQQSESLSFSASISAARTKLITTLIVIVLLMGVAAEALSLLTGVYILRKARCDAAMSAVQVQARGLPMTSTGEPSSVQDYVSACIN
jgi:hypothetical protein